MRSSFREAFRDFNFQDIVSRKISMAAWPTQKDHCFTVSKSLSEKPFCHLTATSKPVGIALLLQKF